MSGLKPHYKIAVIGLGYVGLPLKGGKEFQKEAERMIIVSNIKAMDKAILSIDTDRTVCRTIEMIAKEYGDQFELGFVNG